MRVPKVAPEDQKRYWRYNLLHARPRCCSGIQTNIFGPMGTYKGNFN